MKSNAKKTGRGEKYEVTDTCLVSSEHDYKNLHMDK